ncbi:hypothetical protein [Maridesulfovibrio ferrireducens]|uniref:hypothetical protein n=1 Tax=Maridesulfovibrio ferrireducens TaxID=246191 RepID=UPI001A227461|nr:hypothetical protein [Maridesulfovibrio ferrireducens]MBI9109979.1 hypothetical protein [Maridesulfovibrio ferrireducens]
MKEFLSSLANAQPLFQIDVVSQDGSKDSEHSFIANAVNHISDRDLLTIGKFVNSVYKICNDYSLPEKEDKDCRPHEMKNSLFQFVVYNNLLRVFASEGLVIKNSNEYADKLKSKFNSQARIICEELLFNKEESILCRLSNKKRAKMKKRVKDVQNILEKLIKKVDRTRKGIYSLKGIEYWAAEYRKRQFVLDLYSDVHLLERVKCLFDSLLVLYDRMMSKKSAGCYDCVWRLGERTPYYGLPVLRGTGCNNPMCNFSKFVSQQVEKAAVLNGYHPEKSMHRFQHVKRLYESIKESDLTTLLELSLKYKMYPLELFAIPSAEQLLTFLKKNSCFPDHFPFDYAVKVNWGASRSSSIKIFNQKLNDSKKSLNFNYHEISELRILGLWFWDKMHNQYIGDKKELKLVIEETLEAEWFADTETGSVLLAVKEKSQSKIEYKGYIDRYHKCYKLAVKCIEEGKVLPLNSV